MTDPDQRMGLPGFLLRGLNSSVTGNAQAFGFSITITVTFGIVDAAEGQPTRLDLLGFAMAAVAAISVLNVLVFLLVDHDRDADDLQRALLIGTATDFLAVAAARRRRDWSNRPRPWLGSLAAGAVRRRTGVRAGAVARAGGGSRRG